MEDTYLHKGLRIKLVNEIQQKGINDERVLKAIGKVPRHLFMDSGFIKFAYKDQAFPIKEGQTISQPYTVAFQTSLLDISEGDKVLEIGTGSGYQTAILLEMGAMVYSIERKRELYIGAGSILEKLGYKARLFYGDGYQGKPTYGPFNKILITAAAPNIPEDLNKQLSVGGRLVVPVGDRNFQVMKLIERLSSDKFQTSNHGQFVFVPMVKGMS